MGGSGGELVNLPPYVGVEHRIILAANAQCHIRIRFILFSVLSSLILCVAQKESNFSKIKCMIHKETTFPTLNLYDSEGDILHFLKMCTVLHSEPSIA